MKRLMPDRMVQGDRAGMQRRARDEHWRVRAAIERIACQRQVDRGEVRANLMCAPGLGTGFEQGMPLETLDHEQTRDSRLAKLPIDHGAMAAIAVGAQRQIDRVLSPLRHAGCDGMIAFADGTRIKRDVQGAMAEVRDRPDFVLADPPRSMPPKLRSKKSSRSKIGRFVTDPAGGNPRRVRHQWGGVAFALEAVSSEDLYEPGPFCLCDHPADNRWNEGIISVHDLRLHASSGFNRRADPAKIALINQVFRPLLNDVPMTFTQP